MKKRYIIIMIVQAFFILLLFVFGFMQKSEADKQRAVSLALKEKAVMNSMEAEKQIKSSEEKIKQLQLEIDELKKQVKK